LEGNRPGLEDINKEPGKTQMWRVDGFNDN
jgi:hypothetical protein